MAVAKCKGRFRAYFDICLACGGSRVAHASPAAAWNVGGKQLGRECADHPAVRGTSYQEIHELLGTSGCSNDAEMWDWSRLGVIETKRGRLVVYPNDLIIERNGEFYPE